MVDHYEITFWISTYRKLRLIRKKEQKGWFFIHNIYGASKQMCLKGVALFVYITFTAIEQKDLDEKQYYLVHLQVVNISSLLSYRRLEKHLFHHHSALPHSRKGRGKVRSILSML